MGVGIGKLFETLVMITAGFCLLSPSNHDVSTIISPMSPRCHQSTIQQQQPSYYSGCKTRIARQKVWFFIIVTSCSLRIRIVGILELPHSTPVIPNRGS